MQKRNIIHKLEPYPVEVKILPSIAELASGRIEVSDIRHIEIDDLLGRDPVQPFKDLMKRNILDKVVMVTGAGGSIGSEISRQVISTHPSKLILLELSELALYTIEAELAELVELEEKRANGVWPARKKVEIVSVLGSVGDEVLLRELLRTHKVDTVYHTAAYKHIPLLEKNPVPAIENNVFATVTLARALMEHEVENMVLISSDKAVRPVNIKGASNRLQELILQALAADKDNKTVFAIVRFGNVLDSSGSVVPRFREQIKKGGPVTVTHQEIIRYFMSIREAAQLVIQAGAMACGGEVYVLDMGEPVKIDNLARTMIRLSGKEVCDEENPNGDIEVKYIGLRPGDKMYEELLIEGNVIGSRHPYIMRLSEPSCIGMKELTTALEALGVAMRDADISKLKNVLQNVVEGYGEKSVLQDMQKRNGEEGADRDKQPTILH
ncbi:MAG: polysaccharide biosynthesis protein [Hyphomicrobiaceae bacterium]|nr:polysaccharide biosynthesis protein [Hyphomicrobiaceae bacterium]